MKNNTLMYVVATCFLWGGSCTKNNEEEKAPKAEAPSSSAEIQSASKSPEPPSTPQSEFKLPEGVVWEKVSDMPLFGAQEAVKGGTYKTALVSFPLTFRTVGPDSNGAFRSAILGNQYSLLSVHPNTKEFFPVLSTKWAVGKDNQTVYYMLNENARWSDGKPVKATDYTYTLEFMRSKHINAPWYNNYYNNEIESVTVHADNIISVKSSKPHFKRLLLMRTSLTPTPRHFFTLDKDWVSNYNWKIVPNTGPYQIKDFKKGKTVVFERKKDWWAKDLRYFQNRFNVDRVIYKVVRDLNAQWEYFKKGEIDIFQLTLPNYWHDKSKIDIFEKGYVNKLWFYGDSPQPMMGIFLNQEREIFKDRNVRYAFAHAMNIDKVIREVLRSDYERLHTIMHGYGEYSNYDFKARSYDIGKVSEYMKASGWNRGKDGIWEKEGKKFKVSMTYGYAHHEDRLVVIKEEAKKAGLDLDLNKIDGNAAFKYMLEKKHEAAWTGWGATLMPQFWGQYHSENAGKPQTNNFTGTADPKIDEQIMIYRDSFDESVKIAASKKLQQLIHDEGASIPTFLVPYFRVGYWRYWKLPKVPATKLSGSAFSPFDDSTGGLFWLDKDLQKETKAAMKSGKSFKQVVTIDKKYKVK